MAIRDREAGSSRTPEICNKNEQINYPEAVLLVIGSLRKSKALDRYLLEKVAMRAQLTQFNEVDIFSPFRNISESSCRERLYGSLAALKERGMVEKPPEGWILSESGWQVFENLIIQASLSAEDIQNLGEFVEETEGLCARCWSLPDPVFYDFTRQCGEG